MGRVFTSRRSRVLCAVVASTFLGVSAGYAQSTPRDPEAFLKAYVPLTSVERTAFDRGESIAQLVDTTTKRELAICGAVRLAVTGKSFAASVRDIANYKKGDAILQLGRFSNPPRLDDLNALTLEHDDIAALKQCRLGDSDVRLTAAQIERVQNEIDWKRPGFERRANELVRSMLFDTVTSYLARGDAALADYRDRKRPLSLSDESRSLLAASSYLAGYVPELCTYLEQYPAGRLANAETFLYWSKEKFGLKPVVSVTHVTLYTVERAGVTSVIVVSKQLYASRYFDSSLAVTVFVEAAGSAAATPDAYLVYLNRSRTDQLGGILGAPKRAIVEGRMLKGLRSTLQTTKLRLEQGYRDDIAACASGRGRSAAVALPLQKRARD